MADINKIPDGIEYSIQADGKILLRINPKADFGLSSSKKNTIHASTRGGVEIGGITINLNAYSTPKGKPAKKPVKKLIM